MTENQNERHARTARETHLWTRSSELHREAIADGVTTFPEFTVAEIDAGEHGEHGDPGA